MLFQSDIAKALDKFDSILKDHPYSPRALWGKALVMDKMSEQQRSNKLLEEAMSLMDQSLRLSKTPEKLLLEIASKLTDRQSFRGKMKSRLSWPWYLEVGQTPDYLDHDTESWSCCQMAIPYIYIGLLVLGLSDNDRITEALDTLKFP